MHARLEEIRATEPIKVEDGHIGINGKIAVAVTGFVGSMKCAYLFALLALVSLPAAIMSGNPVVLVSWISQTFLQLVLLSVIIVGQNIQAKASDKRAAETFKDVEAILSELHEIRHAINTNPPQSV